MTVPARQKSTPAAEDVTLKLTAVFSHPQADNSYECGVPAVGGKKIMGSENVARTVGR